MSGKISSFIYLGMTDDRWPFLTPETIQYHLDEPDSMDDEDFIEDFFKWFEIWYAENGS